ncbi:MAG TPA: type II toxin-antitoxin system VapC family toxin [Bryobacteraceae bacterium]|jgi:ribonuclease VapC
MVIDSSALLTIVLGEPDAQIYIDAIDAAFAEERSIYVPASVLVEAGIVADIRNRGPRLDALLDHLQPEIVPLERSLAALARRAFHRFGRGRHPARLNFGDCLSYATAEFLHLPLLYKGTDFKRTAITSVL